MKKLSMDPANGVSTQQQIEFGLTQTGLSQSFYKASVDTNAWTALQLIQFSAKQGGSAQLSGENTSRHQEKMIDQKRQ